MSAANLAIVPSGRAKPSRAAILAAHLKAHGISAKQLKDSMTESLMARLPAPPDGWQFYELADAGRRSVAGLRLRHGRLPGVSFILSASIKQSDGRFKNAQFVLGKWKPDGSGMGLTKARDEATALKVQLRAGVDPRVKPPEPTPEQLEADKPITLRMAWDMYKAARTGRKKKPLAASTQDEYTRIIETALATFLDRPLSDFGSDPRELIKHFNSVSERAPGEANTQMRVLRAVWNRAHKVMPDKVPAPPAIWDMNEMEARDAGFVTDEVKRLWQAIDKLENPQARKGAFVFLLTGLREGAVLPMQKPHINHAEKTLFVPRTKGKTLRLPLSDVAYSLLIAPTPENMLLPENPYLFPSLRGPRKRKGKDLAAGDIHRHIDKLKYDGMVPPEAYVHQRGEDASVHPHVFRHSYRTLATSAHVSEIAIRLLMGHSLRGDVSFDYLTADLTWLRKAQEEISAYILEAAGVGADFRFAPDAFTATQDAA
ncbi:MAG: tyrosine-type recombinase/integrase [Caulobacterales bacterium]|nr:tyrosine-type recombinase/integrase [Caulobacterales bacterium]